MRALFVLCLLAIPAVGLAQGAPKQIHMVYMGGHDCPPCVRWRADELPKLEKTEVFKSVRFSYVEKRISSPVPPSLFLPAAVKPYKDKLQAAGNEVTGSPLVAILVDGEVYDFYWGTRDAALLEKMFLALRAGEGYEPRCLKILRGGKCALRPAAEPRGLPEKGS